MPVEGFTRINTFVNNPLTGEPCFQRFDVPSQPLRHACRAHLGLDISNDGYFASTILSAKLDLLPTQLPPNAPLNAAIKHDARVQTMLDDLDGNGVLIPVNTSLPMGSSATRGKGVQPQLAQS